MERKFGGSAKAALVRPLARALYVAVLAASSAAYGAKPVPSLNAAVCSSLSGVWASPTCTINAGVTGVANSDFRITKASALSVKGGLTINPGVTISNAGVITIENSTGVTPPEFGDAGLVAGILLLGAIDNAGAITIQNATESTAGIMVSVSVSAADPPVPSPLVVVPGVLINAGTIAIQNSGLSQGINSLGTMNNTATGVITITSSLTGSVGIRNRRDFVGGGQYYLAGTLNNAGTITAANTGDGDSRAISNAGSFTNAATGTFTIAASTVTDVLAYGFRNNGSFTNFGTFINNRGAYDTATVENSTWGSYNLGTMVNYGKTIVGSDSARAGTFYNQALMVNLGDITSYGTFYDAGAFMVNYATFYNYGRIVGGGNAGICIDEPDSNGGC